MLEDDRRRVSSDDFLSGDVYIDYPYEDAKFRWDKATNQVYRRFYGEPETAIDSASALYHEAISGGWLVSRDDYYRD